MVAAPRAASPRIELTVERLVAGGNGLARHDGLSVFVPFSAPDDRVIARLVVRKRDYAVAEIEQLLEPSRLRVIPPCPYYGRCGGCQLQHISYQGQLAVKRLMVEDALRRIGRIFVPVADITPADPALRYRNKTQYPVGHSNQKGDTPVVGFYRRESHDLLDVPECMLHPIRFDELRAVFTDAVTRAREKPYDERAGDGNIRHLVLRTNGAECLAVVATRTDGLDRRVIDALAGSDGVTGVVQNINPHTTNRILGDRFVTRSGSSALTMRTLEMDLGVAAGSFFQVNLSQAEVLCRKVLKFLEPTGDEELLDLYSGVGMIALAAARLVRSVIGVESDDNAVANARLNAERNGIRNARFVAGDVDRYVGQSARADLVVLDPPRKGCRPETLRLVAGLRPRRLVYVSCNPATLARDLALLVSLGYNTTAVEPVDMFPQTSHVEVVCRLDPA